MSQERVAEALGLTPGAVSKWLTDKGRNEPSPDYLARAVALCPGGSIDELFGISSKLAAENAALRARLARVQQLAGTSLAEDERVAHEALAAMEHRSGKPARRR